MNKKYQKVLLLWFSISITLNCCLIAYGNFILLIPLLSDALSIYGLYSNWIRLKRLVFVFQVLIQTGFIVFKCVTIQIQPPIDTDAESRIGFVVEMIMGSYLFAGYIIGNIVSYILFFKHIQFAKEHKMSFKINELERGTKGFQ